MNILTTAPAAQRCRYHAFSPYCENNVKTKYRRLKFLWRWKSFLTLDAGKMYRADSSGRMNKLTSHPHASNLNERSCQRATNEKIKTVVTATFFVPPKGI